MSFDITPGRIIGEDESSYELNLCLNQDDEEASSRTKTNIDAQIKHIKGRTAERETVKLLKVWKSEHFTKAKSFLIELLTIRAYDDFGKDKLPTTVWGRLEMTMEFIRDNIKTISLKDPGNSNNNVAESLTERQRKKFAKEMKRALKQISKDADKLEFYFKVNPSYPCPEPEKKDQKASTNQYQVGTSSGPSRYQPTEGYA